MHRDEVSRCRWDSLGLLELERQLGDAGYDQVTHVLRCLLPEGHQESLFEESIFF